MAWLRIALMLPQNFLRDRGELDLENLAMAYVIAGVVATLYLAFLVLLSGMALPPDRTSTSASTRITSSCSASRYWPSLSRAR